MQKEAYIHGSANGRAYYFLFSILSYDDIPLVFAAKDAEGELYLCDCVEMRNTQRWIVAKTNYMILNDIVNKKKTVFEALCSDNYFVNLIELDYGNGTFHHYERRNLLDLPQTCVPDEDSYISFPEEDAARQIRIFSYLDTSVGSSQVVKASSEANDNHSPTRYKANELKQEGSQYAQYEENEMSIEAA